MAAARPAARPQAERPAGARLTGRASTWGWGPGIQACGRGWHVGTQACVGVVWAAMNGPIVEPLRPQMAFAFGVASIESMRVHAIRAARPPREFHCRESERLALARTRLAGRTSGPRLTLRCSVDDVLRVAHGM